MMKYRVCRDCEHRSRQVSTKCPKCKGYMRVDRRKKHGNLVVECSCGILHGALGYGYEDAIRTH